MLYRSSSLSCSGLAGVSRCRAAVRRCGVETSSAPQIPATFCKWHQTKAGANRNGLNRNELSSLCLLTGTTLGQANPLSMRLSQCPRLSQSKCRSPEAVGDPKCRLEGWGLKSPKPSIARPIIALRAQNRVIDRGGGRGKVKRSSSGNRSLALIFTCAGYGGGGTSFIDEPNFLNRLPFFLTTESDPMEQLTQAEFEAMAITSATEVMARWLDAMPDGGAMARTHLAAGAGLEMLIQFSPVPAMGLRLVDSDGSYVALHSKTFGV